MFSEHKWIISSWIRVKMLTHNDLALRGSEDWNLRPGKGCQGVFQATLPAIEKGLEDFTFGLK